MKVDGGEGGIGGEMGGCYALTVWDEAVGVMADDSRGQGDIGVTVQYVD